VKGAFERFLDCGVLAKGFVRVRCPECGYDTAVSFSCKERGLCPSCTVRRMDEVVHFEESVSVPSSEVGKARN